MTHSDSMVLIKTEVFPADSYPDGPLVTEWNITRFLTPQELDTYNCLFSSASPQLTPGYLTSAGTVLINLLPSSPDSVRIPTIINQALGQGTLGANVAIELYSTIWQFLTVILLIKFYKLIPFKAT